MLVKSDLKEWEVTLRKPIFGMYRTATCLACVLLNSRVRTKYQIYPANPEPFIAPSWSKSLRMKARPQQSLRIWEFQNPEQFFPEKKTSNRPHVPATWARGCASVSWKDGVLEVCALSFRLWFSSTHKEICNQNKLRFKLSE